VKSYALIAHSKADHRSRHSNDAPQQHRFSSDLVWNIEDSEDDEHKHHAEGYFGSPGRGRQPTANSRTAGRQRQAGERVRTGEPRPGVYRDRDRDGERALDEARVEPDALGLIGADDAHAEEHVVDVREHLREADGIDEPDEAQGQELPPRDRRHLRPLPVSVPDPGNCPFTTTTTTRCPHLGRSSGLTRRQGTWLDIGVDIDNVVRLVE